MSPLGIVAVAVGMAAVVVGLWRVRGPLAGIRRLQATEANLARYDAWRGNRRAIDDTGPTGAAVMRELLRRQVTIWGGVAIGGVVLVLVGLVLG